MKRGGRTKSYEIGVAGLHPVSIYTPPSFPAKSVEQEQEPTSSVSGSKKEFALSGVAAALEVENLDVSHLISSHADYPLALASILDLVKLR